ncbi:hypothetical protein B484DRAFT_406608 [Ochromonadaceae sp. CCMP2298]|nr:hypothetical protein B484DRAFT_406608 [Ochromonadaceae sp. CCMP2298]
MNSLRVVVGQIARGQVRKSSGKSSGMRDVFEKTDHIRSHRSRFYANPEVGAENPTYLKQSGDKIVTSLAAGGLGLGFLCIFSGLYSMAYGINKN